MSASRTARPPVIRCGQQARAKPARPIVTSASRRHRMRARSRRGRGADDADRNHRGHEPRTSIQSWRRAAPVWPARSPIACRRIVERPQLLHAVSVSHGHPGSRSSSTSALDVDFTVPSGRSSSAAASPKEIPAARQSATAARCCSAGPMALRRSSRSPASRAGWRVSSATPPRDCAGVARPSARQELMIGDAVEPEAQLATAAEAGQSHPGGHESLLRQIVRRGPIAAEAAQKGANGLLMALDQAQERLTRAGLRLRDDDLFGRRRHHFPACRRSSSAAAAAFTARAPSTMAAMISPSFERAP